MYYHKNNIIYIRVGDKYQSITSKNIFVQDAEYIASEIYQSIIHEAIELLHAPILSYVDTDLPNYPFLGLSYPPWNIYFMTNEILANNQHKLAQITIDYSHYPSLKGLLYDLLSQ